MEAGFINFVIMPSWARKIDIYVKVFRGNITYIKGDEYGRI